MNLIVKDIVEHEDGSATITFDMDDQTRQALIQHALIDILTKAAEAEIKRNEVRTGD